MVGVLAAGFALFTFAWAFSSVPYRPPDETAHYVRAASIASGTLLGPKASVTGETPVQTAFLKPDGRADTVDAKLAPPGLPCINGKPVPSTGRCAIANYVGNYQPLPYLLPALAVRFASNADSALWLGRIAAALQSMAFVALALALLWEEGGWSILGLLLALTPSVLFLGSVINPDGLEVVASLTCAAGSLRISRGPADAARWVWAATALGAVVTVLAWQLGWVFVLADIAVAAALAGRAQLRELLAARRRTVYVSGLAVGTALALYLAWGLSTGLLHGTFGVSPFWQGLHAGFRELRFALHDAVALFGAVDVPLPSGIDYWVWWGLVLALGAGAMALASARERAIVMAVTLVALAFPVLFYSWVQRHSGFGLEGRYVLPLLALVPLVCGELVFRHRRELSPHLTRFVPSTLIAVIGCFQLLAWWINARVSAGEPHAFWFLGSPRWSPPGGWAPWTIAATLGSLALVACAARDAVGVAGPAVRLRERELLGSTPS